MKFLGKYWKVLLAIILLLAAYFFYQKNYVEKKANYESEVKRIETYITAMERSIEENMRYAAVQDLLKDANEEIDESRLAMYQQFPVTMLQEDQIMYVLYLEKLFGTEIFFAFSEPQPITVLRDGATLMGLTLTVNYETTYDGFMEMITYLSTDSRVTSVQFASIEYDAANDKATGTVTLLLYLMDSPLLEYLPPEVAQPETGKDNIYD